MHQAQYAAKVASCTRSLWATLRAFDWSDNSFAVHLGANLIEEHLIEGGIYSAKNYIDIHDFYETPGKLRLRLSCGKS